MNREASKDVSDQYAAEETSWKILMIDQDESLHHQVQAKVDSSSHAGLPILLLHAYGISEAKLILQNHTDLGILLIGQLDEHPMAAKELVPFLRDTLKNHWTRVLYCGAMPLGSLAEEYSIQGELLHEQLGSGEFWAQVGRTLNSYQEVLTALSFSNQGPHKKNFFVQDAVAIFKWKNLPGWPVEYVTLNVLEILGYSDRDFAEGRVAYLDILFEADADRVKQEVVEYSAMDVTHFEQEYRVVKADGTVIWVYDYTSKLFDSDGKITHFIGYVFDITANKESEGIEDHSATTPSMMLDTEQRITQANLPMAALLGERADHLFGQSLDTWLGDQERSSFANFISICSIGGLPQRFELAIGPPDQKQRGLFYLTRVLDPTHHEAGFHCLIENLTERSHREDALKDELVKERTFIASASHELRTPLSAILGYAELLKDARGLDPEQQGFLANIVTNSKHLVTLVNDILDLSKIESNQLGLNIQEVVFSDLFTSSGVMISSRVKQNVKLMVSAPDLAHYVLCDPVRIKQIFLNLLSNAAKFTEHGVIKLYLAEYTPIDNNLFSVRICVEDTGPGIAEDRQGELFQPFRQVHQGGNYGGTGLGLYLSRQIARLMDGDITLHSSPGRGSTFTIELVLTKGRVKGDLFAFNGKRVVILGDYPSLSDQQKDKLVQTGASIEFIDCVNPRYLDRFRDILAFDQVDVAILDLDVLKEKTVWYAGALRETYPAASLIGLKQKSTDLKIDLLDQSLLKPFSYYQLASVLDEEFKRFKPLYRVDYSELSILIVEDVEANRMLFFQMFQRFFNLEPKMAINGEDALVKLREGGYDMVFMDVEMPIMDGIEATRRIREFDQTTPIVAMTGNVFAEDIEETKRAGMTGFLSKPIQKEELEKALMSLFEEREISGEPPVFADDLTEPPVLSDAPGPALNNTELTLGSLEAVKRRMMASLADLSDDQDTLREIVDTAVIEIKEAYGKIIEETATEDWPKLGKSLHKLKGILLNMNIQPFGDQVKELETQVRKDDEARREETMALLEAFIKDFGHLSS
ncbi:MAG: ATP-binding protein [bacterium]|nr:ATP-binding protein [bacterium]